MGNERLPIMKFGFNVWFKTEFMGDKLWKHAREAGFSHVEFALDYPWPWENTFRKAVREAAGYGFSIGVHLPWKDLSLASPFPGIRQASVETAVSIIDYLSDLDIDYAVAHVSSNEWIPEHRLNAYIENIAKDLEPLVRKSRETGIVLSLENAQKPFITKPSYLKKLALLINANICLDLGHIVATEFRRGASIRRTERTLKKWLKETGALVSVVHVHGNDNKGRAHKSVSYLHSNLIVVIRDIIRELSLTIKELPVVAEVFYEEESPVTFIDYLEKDIRLIEGGKLSEASSRN